MERTGDVHVGMMGHPGPGVPEHEGQVDQELTADARGPSPDEQGLAVHHRRWSTPKHRSEDVVGHCQEAVACSEVVPIGAVAHTRPHGPILALRDVHEQRALPCQAGQIDDVEANVLQRRGGGLAQQGAHYSLERANIVHAGSNAPQHRVVPHAVDPPNDDTATGVGKPAQRLPKVRQVRLVEEEAIRAGVERRGRRDSLEV
jgi:hypothetical protein